MPTFDEILAQRKQQLLEQELPQEKPLDLGLIGNIAPATPAFREQEATGIADRANARLNNNITDLYKAKTLEDDAQASDPKSPISQQAQQMVAKKLNALSQMVKRPIPKTYLESLADKSKKDLEKADTVSELLNVFKLMKDDEDSAKKNKSEKPSVFDATYDRKSAELFQKQVEAAPTMVSRLDGIEEMKQLADKVFTGPLVGKDLAFAAQKVGNKDAQRIEAFLARENVDLIMRFAKEAGVRSVDTEQEQQRLLKSIANKEMSKEVLKESLGRMQKLLAEGLELTKSKQDYVNQHGNLRGWNPPAMKEQKNTSAKKEVERLDKKSGKVAIFDADSKQFLRWK